MSGYSCSTASWIPPRGSHSGGGSHGPPNTVLSPDDAGTACFASCLCGYSVVKFLHLGIIRGVLLWKCKICGTRLFARSLEDNENSNSADKIQLPEQKPQTTSRWHQKMLNKLEKMENTSSQSMANNNNGNNPSSALKPPSGLQPPHLNRSLQVQGQGSNCCSKLQSSTTAPTTVAPSPSRYKTSVTTSTSFVSPPISKPKQPAFSYTDPLPFPISYLHSKDNLSPFEERILELEKMERDSILIERTSKPRVSNREITTKIPATLLQQPKYLENTASFQSRISQRKSASNGSSTGGKSRSLTPTSNNNMNGRYGDSKRKTIREKETILQQKRKNGNKVTISTRS